MLEKRPASKKIIVLVALCSMGWFFLGAAAPKAAWSRNWKPAPSALAQDYSIITDARDNHDIKMIFWLSSLMLPEGHARELFDHYVIVGVTRAHISPVGTMSFDIVDTLQASDGGGAPLRLLSGDNIPPLVNGMVSAMTSMLGQSLGPLGKGIHWFVFEAGSVHACVDGGLSIPFADEVYTYQTPIPGCPRK